LPRLLLKLTFPTCDRKATKKINIAGEREGGQEGGKAGARGREREGGSERAGARGREGKRAGGQEGGRAGVREGGGRRKKKIIPALMSLVEIFYQFRQDLPW
jgi:hypothetical protein